MRKSAVYEGRGQNRIQAPFAQEIRDLRIVHHQRQPCSSNTGARCKVERGSRPALQRHRLEFCTIRSTRSLVVASSAAISVEPGALASLSCSSTSADS